MARKGTELATAYYSLVPSLDGTAAAVNSQIGLVTGPAGTVGQKGGAALGAGLIGGLKAAGIVGAAIGIVGLAQQTADYFSDAVTLASNLQESGNAVRVSYGSIAGEIEKLGETSAKRLGLSNTAFNDLAVRFSGFAGTIAGEGGDVAGVIDELTTRGADFASVFNLDAADALTIFQSGLAGENEPLRKFGIDLSAAAVDAFALANGIGEQGRELTESEKVQARYGLLLEETSQTAGDFAGTSDSLANAQRIANARFEDAQAKIGEALLPTMEKFTDFLITDGVPLVEKLVDVFIALEPAISFVADGIIAWLDVVSGGIGFITDFIAAVEDGETSISELRDVFSNFPVPVQDALIAIAQFVYDTVAGVANAVSGSLNNVIGFINGVLDALKPVARFLNDTFGLSLRIPTLRSIPGLGGLNFDRLLRGNPTNTGIARGGGRVALAEGGVVSARAGGVPATIGEGRYDEAVIPLSPSVLSQLGAAMGGGGASTLVVVDADGALVGRMRVEASRKVSEFSQEQARGIYMGWGSD